MEGGWGMDGVLKARQHVLNGIANGIDMEEWDPETDEFTAAKYSLADLSGAYDILFIFHYIFSKKPTSWQDTLVCVPRGIKGRAVSCRVIGCLPPRKGTASCSVPIA